MEPEPVADQPLPTISPTVNPTPPISPVVPIPKPKSRTGLFIRGILILGLGFTIGLLFNKNLSPTSQVPATPTTLLSPIPQAKPDLAPPATANWKTYADSKYGFSFNHPNLDDTCCRLAGAISDNPVYIVTLADKSTVRPNSDAPFDGLAVYIVPNKNDLTLAQYIEKEKAALISDFESMADPGQINQGVTTKTSINGLPAIVLSNYSWDGITRTYFKSNNNSFIFEISKNEKSPNHFASYDQILSTFTFIDAEVSNPKVTLTPIIGWSKSNQVDDLSTWVLYSNAGVSFTYPSFWKINKPVFPKTAPTYMQQSFASPDNVFGLLFKVDKPKQNSDGSFASLDETFVSVPNKTHIMIDGHDAIKYQPPYDGSGAWNSWVASFYIDNQHIMNLNLFVQPANTDQAKLGTTTFDQIVSSIKFTK